MARRGALPRDGFTAGFYQSPKAVGDVGIGDQISVYIDITTTPTWMHIAEGSAVSTAIWISTL